MAVALFVLAAICIPTLGSIISAPRMPSTQYFKVDEKLHLMKCCGHDQWINTHSRLCTPAPWPRNKLANRTERPFSLPWMRHWIPPGIPLEAIDRISFKEFHKDFPYSVRVVGSDIWNDKLSPDDNFRSGHVLFKGNVVVRRNTGAGVRYADYCIDALSAESKGLNTTASPADFSLQFRTCSQCIEKCCPKLYWLIQNGKGIWECRYVASQRKVTSYVYDLRGKPRTIIRNIRHPNEQTVTEIRESVSHYTLTCGEGTLSVQGTGRGGVTGEWTQNNSKPKMESFDFTRTSCWEKVKNTNGLFEDRLVFCHIPRHTRAVYWAARPLSFAAILLLATALVVVVTKSRLRQSTHGWTLACHAVCLLGFNILQVGYYYTISEEVDSNQRIPVTLKGTCLAYGFSAYFLLTAAGTWLTAVCWNVSAGFNQMRVVRSGSSRKRFLKLSAFGWGIPLVLTATCAAVFTTQSPHYEEERGDIPWYVPTLLETRTCFQETMYPMKGYSDDVVSSSKWGTGLYYYAPMGTLILVNIAFLVRTARRIQYLRRGNSVLTRDEKDIRILCTENEGRKEMPTNESRKEEVAQKKIRPGTQPKSLTVYIKLILSAGAVETTAEIVAWAISSYEAPWMEISEAAFLDQSCVYRAVGYLADVTRAAIVLWLASPERGDLRALCRRSRSHRKSP